jgi:hypothetical protein
MTATGAALMGMGPGFDLTAENADTETLREH